jgi:ABC-2 type transport system ATP-binding protein
LDVSDATADPATSRTRIHQALARVGLSAAAGKKYSNYSLGMKQRLGLAASLLRPRELLILDEPTSGLEPQGTREVRHLIRELACDGTTVLVSSHLLSEIEQVATHVCIMSGGKLLRQGTLTNVLSDGASAIRVITPDTDTASTVMDSLGLQEIHAEVGAAPLSPGSATSWPSQTWPRPLAAAGVRLRGLSVDRPDLGDLFVSITGEGFYVLS